MSDDAELPRGWQQRVVGALGHRNFRIVWFAALGSTIGTWMQQYAQSWLVYQLTKSNFYLGIDSFLGQLPILLLMLIGGVIADRHDRRRLLTTSQYIQSAAAFALAILVYTNTVQVGYIFLLSFIAGCGQAFGGPAYQSLIPSLVPRRDLPSAIGLNSTQFNLSRALGPAVGGAVLATIGMAWCFALNGLSFFIVIIALAWLHLPKHMPAKAHKSIRTDLQTGLRYVRGHRLIMTLIALGFVATFLAMPLITLMPSFATDVLGGFGTPEARLSMLMAFQGFGAITGALIVGYLGQFKRMGAALLTVQIALGLLLAVVRDIAHVRAQPAPALPLRHVLHGGLLDQLLARAAHGAGRAARPGHQHLHGRAAIGRTDRGARRRRVRRRVLGAGGHGGQRPAALAGGRHTPFTRKRRELTTGLKRCRYVWYTRYSRGTSGTRNGLTPANFLRSLIKELKKLTSDSSFRVPDVPRRT